MRDIFKQCKSCVFWSMDETDGNVGICCNPESKNYCNDMLNCDSCCDNYISIEKYFNGVKREAK